MQFDDEPVPLWVDEVVTFVWHGRTLFYSPRLPRQHLEPIEDEA